MSKSFIEFDKIALFKELFKYFPIIRNNSAGISLKIFKSSFIPYINLGKYLSKRSKNYFNKRNKYKTKTKQIKMKNKILSFILAITV